MCLPMDLPKSLFLLFLSEFRNQIKSSYVHRVTILTLGYNKPSYYYPISLLLSQNQFLACFLFIWAQSQDTTAWTQKYATTSKQKQYPNQDNDNNRRKDHISFDSQAPFGACERFLESCDLV